MMISINVPLVPSPQTNWYTITYMTQIPLSDFLSIANINTSIFNITTLSSQTAPTPVCHILCIVLSLLIDGTTLEKSNIISPPINHIWLNYLSSHNFSCQSPNQTTTQQIISIMHEINKFSNALLLSPAVGKIHKNLNHTPSTPVLGLHCPYAGW